jgi:SAM-dependent methyltransferase
MDEQRQLILDQFTRQAVPFVEIHARDGAAVHHLLIDTAGITAADYVLDVACGPGLVACEVAKVAKHVTGIDLTPAMIDQAKARQQSSGLANLTWVVGDACPLPFPDAAFSRVITRYSFHHFSDPAGVFAEMVRVCHPGGRLTVADVFTTSAEQAEAYDRLEQLRDPSHILVVRMSVLEFGDGLTPNRLDGPDNPIHGREVVTGRSAPNRLGIRPVHHPRDGPHEGSGGRVAAVHPQGEVVAVAEVDAGDGTVEQERLADAARALDAQNRESSVRRRSAGQHILEPLDRIVSTDEVLSTHTHLSPAEANDRVHIPGRLQDPRSPELQEGGPVGVRRRFGKICLRTPPRDFAPPTKAVVGR